MYEHEGPMPCEWGSTGRANPMPARNQRSVRYLYQIHIVDPKAGAVIFEAKVVASGQTQALLMAGMAESIRLDIDEYDVIVNMIGEVRAKE